MGSQDRKNVDRIILIFRKVTRTVQLLPFVYLSVYAFLLLSETLLPDWLTTLLNALFYVPSSAIVTGLLLSRLLKLCAWHKTACLLPLSSKATEFIDNNIITFTQNEVILINTLLGIVILVFIGAAFKHFFLK